MASPPPQPSKPSFASILSTASPLKFAIADLPSPFVEDGVVSIRITEAPFQRGLDRCKTNLVGRFLLPSKYPPLRTHELAQQLRSCWPSLDHWTVAPLGRGFFMLQFQTITDMQQVWSLGLVRLPQGLFRLIKWTPTFSPSTYKSSFAQVWVKFWDLGFAYWDDQTLFEIAMGVGTPLQVDPRTKNRSVGLYARLLIDVDFSKPLLSTLRVSRANGDAVVVNIEYETKPDFCDRCGSIGH